MLHDKKQNVCEGGYGESLCDGCSALANFDAQHNTQVLSPELSEIRRSLATKINCHHDPFIHRLPLELASKVFVFCIEDFIHKIFRSDRYPLPQPSPNIAAASRKGLQDLAIYSLGNTAALEHDDSTRPQRTADVHRN